MAQHNLVYRTLGALTMAQNRPKRRATQWQHFRAATLWLMLRAEEAGEDRDDAAARIDLIDPKTRVRQWRAALYSTDEATRSAAAACDRVANLTLATAVRSRDVPGQMTIDELDLPGRESPDVEQHRREVEAEVVVTHADAITH
jgi:hypothetical protein